MQRRLMRRDHRRKADARFYLPVRLLDFANRGFSAAFDSDGFVAKLMPRSPGHKRAMPLRQNSRHAHAGCRSLKFGPVMREACKSICTARMWLSAVPATADRPPLAQGGARPVRGAADESSEIQLAVLILRAAHVRPKRRARTAQPNLVSLTLLARGKETAQKLASGQSSKAISLAADSEM